MYISQNGQKLYLNAWNYNAARILTELAAIVENNGGKVKRNKFATVTNRQLIETKQHHAEWIKKLQSVIDAGNGNDKTKAAINNYRDEFAKLESIPETWIDTYFLSYIDFCLNGYRYYYQIDDNMFFPFLFIKTPIDEFGQYSKDAALEESAKEWLFDCFFKSDCSDSDIKEAANAIFNELINAKKSTIIRDSEKIRVRNTYDNGYHFERVYSPERIGKIDY